MLYIHRSERADALVDVLGGLLAKPLGDVMQAEVVAVPSRGIERWLMQRLSDRLGTSTDRADGVCANIDFPFPGALVGQALASASGVDPDSDPWRPERSVWPLLEVVDNHLSEPWLAPLAGHLRNAGPPGQLRRFATVRHIADLYDRYSVHRPEMLRSWASGQNQGTTPEGRWQAYLWRQLRERIGTPSPAERLARACGSLRTDATPLPPAGEVLAVRPDPPSRQLPRRVGSTGRPARRPPLPVAPVAGPLGEAGRPTTPSGACVGSTIPPPD